MYRYALVALVLSCIANATVAQAETIKPIKASKHDIAGAIFQRKNAFHEDKDGNATTDVVTFTSLNMAFQTGVYKSGPAHEEIKGPSQALTNFSIEAFGPHLSRAFCSSFRRHRSIERPT